MNFAEQEETAPQFRAGDRITLSELGKSKAIPIGEMNPNHAGLRQ
jgi:hypothetical protein